MRARVFKYIIHSIGEIVELEIPDPAKICDINFQGDELCLWAVVNVVAPLQKLKFIVYGTGCPINDIENLCFLKTAHSPNGYVWHVFAIND